MQQEDLQHGQQTVESPLIQPFAKYSIETQIKILMTDGAFFQNQNYSGLPYSLRIEKKENVVKQVSSEQNIKSRYRRKRKLERLIKPI